MQGGNLGGNLAHGDRTYYTQQHPRHYRQPSPAPQPPTISSTVDRRTIGNSTVSPPPFYNQRTVEPGYSIRDAEQIDAIEAYPQRAVGSSQSSLCRVNLGSSAALPAEALRVLPAAVHLDASVTCLWVLTPLTATVSAVIVLVAISTSQWLHTEEKMNNPAYNGTGDRSYLSKLTVSGLWKLCSTNPGEENYECSKIDYFSKEEYSPDPNDSTMAIPYAVTKSSVFLLLAAAVMLVGCVCCAVGHCARHRRIYTFTAGVLFIVSGLLMLIGLVMYISVFKAEVGGGKLRQPSFSQQPIFTYRYGYSFLLYVSGFITIEIAGTSAVFLYIYWYQKDWLMKLQSERSYDKYSHSSESNISYTNLEQNSVYPCKRHPQAYTIQRTQPIGAACEPSTSNAFASPSKQRRYFFDRENLQPISPSCSLHKNKNVYVSTSLRDVSTVTCYDTFPPPPMLENSSFGDPYKNTYPEVPRSASTANYRNVESIFVPNVGSTRSLHMSGMNTIPRDATTNTISTTVDVINPCEEFGFGDVAMGPVFTDEFSPSTQREHEFVTFDLERPLELRPSVGTNVNLQPIRKDYSSGTDTLRRTTPV